MCTAHHAMHAQLCLHIIYVKAHHETSHEEVVLALPDNMKRSIIAASKKLRSLILAIGIAI